MVTSVTTVRENPSLVSSPISSIHWNHYWTELKSFTDRVAAWNLMPNFNFEFSFFALCPTLSRMWIEDRADIGIGSICGDAMVDDKGEDSGWYFFI